MPFDVKPTEDIVADIIIEVVGNVAEITDVNTGSVLRNLVEGVGVELGLLYSDLDTIFKGTRILTATGEDLENLGDIVGITRKQGTKAQSNITFSRLQPGTIDFTIPIGSIVSTQPNTGEEQLRYKVVANTTFDVDIDNEQHTFVDGIFQYAMEERIISSLDTVDGTSGALPTTFVENTDFKLVKDVDVTLIDPDSVTLVDDCETADFTESTDATAEVVNAVDFRQGSGSLDLGKSGTASTEASYEKVLTSVVDAGSKKLYVYLDFADQATIDKIAKLDIIVGSGGSAANSLTLDIKNELTTTPFTLYEIDLNDANIVRTGLINLNAINFIKIALFTNAIGDTIASGDVKMDFWIFADGSRYEGDVLEWINGGTLPDDGTTFETDYTPLSKEVLCEAEEVGAKFNVGRHKVIFKVSTIPNIDNVDNFTAIEGGTDTETDADLRVRIQNAADVAGNSTVNALKQAVLAVEGVTSVSVNDTPLKNQADEPIVFHTGIDDYKVDYEVAVDNATLKISNTIGGSADYVKGTDYILSDSAIVWQAGGSKPSGGATFYVTYDYNWLGHVEMFVSGVSTPLNPTVLSNIQEAIDETKAAGVDVQFFEPTVVTVDVTCEISVETTEGFTFDGVKPIVEENLRQYINGLGVGEDVFIAELFRIIQETQGVDNSTISLPASDVSIAATEVAKAGTITITEL